MLACGKRLRNKSCSRCRHASQGLRCKPDGVYADHCKRLRMKCAQPSGPEMGHLTVMNWSPTAPMHLGWSDLNQPLTPKTAPSSASRQLEFGDKVQLFTGAHEIGHLVLHEDTVMHRDRAFDGSPLQAPRAPAERQADRFAACFLMPQKLLRERFEFMFCCKWEIAPDLTKCLHPT